MTHIKRGRINRVKRQEAAKQRAGAGTPTPEGQLKVLDERLGKGVGATKEREKLTKQLTRTKKSKAVK